LTVTSTALVAFGVNFTSIPPCGLMPSPASGAPGTSPARLDVSLALIYGAAVTCPPLGRFSRPVKGFSWQIRQLLLRGSGADQN
jgi:hypothetical protein